MTTLQCVAPNLVSAIWPFVERFIDAAYEATDRVTPDVRTWLQQGHGLLWVVSDGANVVAVAVTSLEQHRGGLACRISACGGEGMDAWLHHLAEIEDYARAEGCYKVWLEGREGWTRVLDGYRKATVSLEKVL